MLARNVFFEPPGRVCKPPGLCFSKFVRARTHAMRTRPGRRFVLKNQYKTHVSHFACEAKNKEKSIPQPSETYTRAIQPANFRNFVLENLQPRFLKGFRRLLAALGCLGASLGPLLDALGRLLGRLCCLLGCLLAHLERLLGATWLSGNSRMWILSVFPKISEGFCGPSEAGLGIGGST